MTIACAETASFRALCNCHSVMGEPNSPGFLTTVLPLNSSISQALTTACEVQRRRLLVPCEIVILAMGEPNGPGEGQLGIGWPVDTGVRLGELCVKLQ